MSKQKKKDAARGKKLKQLFPREDPLGGSVAEFETDLASYYANEDIFVTPICENIPGGFIHVGPKGFGKSAVQKMIVARASTVPARIIEVKPDDISLWSIAKSPELTAQLYDKFDPRWLNKTLWNYLFAVEILRLEYGDFTSLWSKLSAFFSDDKGRIRRLIERGVSATATKSYSVRFIELIEEIKVSGTVSGVELSTTLKPTKTDPKGEKGSILYDLSTVVANFRGLLKNDYLILLDDLDQNWSGEPAHAALLEGLLSSLMMLRRSEKVSFVAAVRDDIFRVLHPEDPDKIRQHVRQLSWQQYGINQMISSRISWATQIPDPSGDLSEIFDSSVKRPAFWQLVADNPRRAVQVLEACIRKGKENGMERVDNRLFMSIAEESSRAFLRDIENLNRYTRPSLYTISQSLRKATREFGKDGLEMVCADLLEQIPKESQRHPQAAWVLGLINSDPLEVARSLLDAGILLYKSSRESSGRIFQYEVDSLDDRSWFAVHPSLAIGLGF